MEQSRSDYRCDRTGSFLTDRQRLNDAPFCEDVFNPADKLSGFDLPAVQKQCALDHQDEADKSDYEEHPHNRASLRK